MTYLREQFRVLKWAVLIGIITAGLTAWVVVMALDNEPPYTFDASQSYIVPSPAREGEQITVRWKVKVNRHACIGSNQRFLFDPVTGAIITIYDPVPTANVYEVVATGYITRTLMLPRGKVLPPGDIGYRAIISYRCNLFQQFWPLVVKTPPLTFRVMPSPETLQ